jgi:hypothetical protein
MRRAALLMALLLGSGCSKKSEPPRRTEPWLANPSASAGAELASGPLRFDVLADSSIRFSVPTRRAKIGGSVPVSSGSLELDPRDLSRTKSSLSFDLTRVVIAPDSLPRDLELGGAEPSTLALQWLELGADVASERKLQSGQARFELSALEDATGDLDLGSNKPSARATATAVGSLLLHGFRAPVRTRVVLQPAPPAVDPQSRASRTIASRARHQCSKRRRSRGRGPDGAGGRCGRQERAGGIRADRPGD